MNILTIFLGVLAGNGLVAFLVALLVIAIIVYALMVLFNWLATQGLPQPIKILLWLIVAVCIVLYLVNRFGGAINL